MIYGMEIIQYSTTIGLSGKDKKVKKMMRRVCRTAVMYNRLLRRPTGSSKFIVISCPPFKIVNIGCIFLLLLSHLKGFCLIASTQLFRIKHFPRRGAHYWLTPRRFLSENSRITLQWAQAKAKSERFRGWSTYEYTISWGHTVLY
jgi:hypothetical protein